MRHFTCVETGGLDESCKGGREEVAGNFKGIGIPASQIAIGTGLSHDEIAKLWDPKVPSGK